MPKIRDGKALTVLQEKFIAAYLADPNGTRAYKTARGGNCSYMTCRIESVKLLANPNVRQEIKAGIAAITKAAKMKAKKIVNGLEKIALADPLDFIDKETGNLLPIEQVPYRARLAVQRIKAKVESKTVQFAKDEDDKETVTEVVTEIVEIALNDRNAALDKLMKHHGLYLNDNTQKHGIKDGAERDAIMEKLKARGISFETVNAPSSN